MGWPATPHGRQRHERENDGKIDAGRRSLRRGGHRRRVLLLCRLSDHARHGDRLGSLAAAPAGRRQVHPDGGRDCLHRRRHRRVRRRRQVHDRYLRPRLQPDAGEYRLRSDDGDPVRHRQRAAVGPLHRTPHQPSPSHQNYLLSPQRNPILFQNTFNRTNDWGFFLNIFF